MYVNVALPLFGTIEIGYGVFEKTGVHVLGVTPLQLACPPTVTARPEGFDWILYCESVWPVPEVRGVNVVCGPDGAPFGVGEFVGEFVGTGPGPLPPPPQPAMNAPSASMLIAANGNKAGRFKRFVLLPCGAGSCREYYLLT